MPISAKKRLEIANVCYANVGGTFARFLDKDMPVTNFKWEDFVDMMEREADLWMMIHQVYKGRDNKDEVSTLARKYAREIAETWVTRSGILRQNNS